MLAMRTAGPPDAPPVVLLHGFTQTSVSWAPIAGPLARDRRVTTVDLPGHGGSGPVRMGLAETAAELAQSCGRATYVGYSMGGRVALRLALDHPEVVEGLVLVGATAGIDDAEERAARRRQDEARAEALEADGVETFLEGWLAQPLFAALDPRPDDLAARRANPAAGLAHSLRTSGTGAMDPPWWDELDGLGRAGVPVTIVVGADDAKFSALGRRMVAAIGPTAALRTIPHTGHACHLEDPDAFAAVLRRALGAPRRPTTPPNR